MPRALVIATCTSGGTRRSTASPARSGCVGRACPLAGEFAWPGAAVCGGAGPEAAGLDDQVGDLLCPTIYTRPTT
jgi:hypothetical protein